MSQTQAIIIGRCLCSFKHAIYLDWLTWYWRNWSQANRCWTNRCDGEASSNTVTIRGDNQNICAPRLKTTADFKLLTTSAVIIRRDQTLKRIGWIKRNIIKAAVSVHWTATCEIVCGSRVNCHLDCLIIIVITSVTIRSGKQWTVRWQDAREGC